ncbi:heat shock 22 kDa protein, mitochondrial-like isoform X1 [Silene latifolia]|uniref:heat shock 22 kDa protein, mitochondrial-like isoform X1 n=1 Tax=Silene latifolia TaxID=37657 RepID=UPI003D7763F7
MASITSLSLTGSPLVLKRVSTGPSTIGLGPRSMVLPLSSTKSKTSATPRLSMTVKAQNYESSDPHSLPKDFSRIALSSTDDLGEDLLETSRFELTPWDYKEEANKIKMWFNMPGIAAQDIRVYVKDNKLFVQGKHLQLPLNIRKEDIKCKLGNGVLYVSIPKTKPEFEPHPILVQPVSW